MAKAKAKVKVSAKPVKNGTGTLIARVPVSVEKNTNPSGKVFYQTKAKVTISPTRLANGQPRPKHRSKKTR